MAAAFTPEEKESIQTSLLAAALKYAQLTGMKKTSVDQLVEEAGISKGAFYHFYASKEHLFLDMLEKWHGDIWRRAAEIYEEHAELPHVERISLMLRESIRMMACQPLNHFIKDDVPILLRRLPPEVVREHYQSDDDFILKLIHMSDTSLLVSEPVAVAVIRILFMSLVHAKEVGEYYPEALDALVNSACRQLVKSE